MATSATEETPFRACRGDSPQNRSSDGDSTGYSTDYSTFGATALHGGRRSTSSWTGEATLPERRTTTYGTYPRIARQAVGRCREEERELVAASIDNGLPKNSDACRDVDYSDQEEENLEREDKEDVMRDEPHYWPSNMNCSLIPLFAIQQWRCCRASCYIWLCVVLGATAITVCVGLFWGWQLFHYRSHISKTVDLATSGAYNVMAEFPRSNVYGSNLCISFEKTPETFDITKLAYVTLVSKSCREMATAQRNEVIQHSSLLQYNSYMFHWLQGTTFWVDITVNGSSLVSIYLLDDRASENFCSNHLKPDNVVMKWMFDFSSCNLNYAKGYMNCHFNYEINKTSTYYLCINTTIDVDLSYNITISSVVYNTSASKTSLECVQGDSCCLPFDDLLSEIFHPTCMFISTQPLSPAFIGMELVNVNLEVGQRLSVFWYCSIALVVLIFILVSSLCLCRLTQYRVNHPDFNPRECTIHCSLYGVKK